jgi:hypothetical protein
MSSWFCMAAARLGEEVFGGLPFSSLSTPLPTDVSSLAAQPLPRFEARVEGVVEAIANQV